jgi:putative intracellular protease/amidase
MKIILLSILFIFIIFSNTEAVTKKILVIFPATHSLSLKEGNKHPTGYFFSEFAIPALELSRQGFEFDVATPMGVVPTMDKTTDSAKWFHSKEEYLLAKSLLESIGGFKKPLILSEIKNSLDKYSSLFIPGGHAAMEDLPANNDLGDVLKYFHANHRPTALICHGPAALLAAREKNGNWIYKDYSLTVFSTAEEKFLEKNGSLEGHVLFYSEDVLRQSGANVNVAPPMQSHVVVDHELVTGQNPMSSDTLVKSFIELLKQTEIK